MGLRRDLSTKTAVFREAVCAICAAKLDAMAVAFEMACQHHAQGVEYTSESMKSALATQSSGPLSKFQARVMRHCLYIFVFPTHFHLNPRSRRRKMPSQYNLDIHHGHRDPVC